MKNSRAIFLTLIFFIFIIFYYRRHYCRCYYCCSSLLFIRTSQIDPTSLFLLHLFFFFYLYLCLLFHTSSPIFVFYSEFWLSILFLKFFSEQRRERKKTTFNDDLASFILQTFFKCTSEPFFPFFFCFLIIAAFSIKYCQSFKPLSGKICSDDHKSGKFARS